jgi:hypothetical protein
MDRLQKLRTPKCNILLLEFFSIYSCLVYSKVGPRVVKVARRMHNFSLVTRFTYKARFRLYKTFTPNAPSDQYS